MRQLLNRWKYLAATLLFVFTTTAMSVPAAFAANANGNNGTLKIHELGTPSGTENNDPKVCVFNVEGFFFDSGQTGYLNFDVQGGDGPTGTAAGPYDFGPTDASGYYASQYFNLDPGHYKATLYGKDTGGAIDLKDVKAKSKVFKVTCETDVKPAAVTFDDQCGTDNDTYTIPSKAGVDYFVNGSTTATPAGTYNATSGQTVTVVAKAADHYTLKDSATHEWSHTFSTEPCEVDLTPVTPAAVIFDDQCELSNDTFTIPSKTGVTYKVGATVLAANTYNAYDYDVAGTVTITAVAQPTYTLTGTTTWSFDFTNVACENCDCGNSGEVIAPEVTFRDVCGLEHDTFVIPSEDHIRYYVNDSPIPASPGKHHVLVAGTVTIKAYADEGFTLLGEDTWNHDFTNEPCVVKVKPPRVVFNDECGMDNDTFTIPARDGVEYQINGQPINPDTYPGSGTVTVTAVAKDGFQLKGKKTTWTHIFKDQECGEGGGAVTPVVPGEVSFTNLTCVKAGAFVVPETEGVVYKDALGNVLTAGSHPVLTASTVTVKAYPINQSVTLTGATEWTHKFVAPANCGHVLGGSTSTPIGSVFVPSGKGAELANTGVNTAATTIIALFLALSALVVYANKPRQANT